MTDLGLSILKGSFAGVERGRFEGETFLCGVDALGSCQVGEAC